MGLLSGDATIHTATWGNIAVKYQCLIGAIAMETTTETSCHRNISMEIYMYLVTFYAK